MKAVSVVNAELGHETPAGSFPSEGNPGKVLPKLSELAAAIPPAAYMCPQIALAHGESHPLCLAFKHLPDKKWWPMWSPRRSGTSL